MPQDTPQVQFMKYKIFLIGLFIYLVSGSIFIYSQTEQKKASFIPLWQPQAQFAGYYVAYELGIYKKYGIELTIIPGGPNSQSSEFLEKGNADFGLLWLSVAIELRAKGIPLVNIAQMSHKSSVLLIARKASGIFSIDDMNDQKISVWGGQYFNIIQPFLKKFNISAKPIPVGATNNLFLLGGTDITTACWFNEYHTIISSGIDTNEIRVFPFFELGLNFPEDGIYCLESVYNKNPQLCSNFVKASIEGWQYTFDNFNNALDIIMKYIKINKIITTRTHQKWMLARMKDLILSQGNSKINTGLSRDEFEFTANSLKESALIKKKPKYEIFYRPCN
jgi:NitT/TauT family transport system substrate-binding protein